MGRPPCCDQVGIKKGPWTPEEDIILVSYIQEHGPGNWRSVPTNTGLMRCSKSCRLRWTNYLRPGIKRGNFTPHEEGMIIHLQALLGNKWAAIASYLSQRTDNDIKNYWNTHLKKKLKKFQVASSDQANASHHHNQFPPRGGHALSSDHRRDLVAAEDVTSSASSSSAMYASSTENISRLLEGWMRSSPKNNTNAALSTTNNNADINNTNNSDLKHQELEKETTSINCCYHPKVEQEEVKDSSSWGLITHEEFESILSFDNSLSGTSNISWDKSSTTGNQKGKQKTEHPQHQQPPLPPPPAPLSIFEKWLFDETTNGGQVEEIMELRSIL